MTVFAGSTITTSSYNEIFVEISNILNGTEGGYGPNIRSSTTATSSILASYDHWNLIYNDVNNSIKHQSGSNIPNLTPPVRGELITAAFVNTLADSAVIAVNNSLTAHVSQLSPSTSTLAFVNVPWDSEIQIQRTYQWRDNLRTHHHFNLGGYIISNVDYVGGPPTSLQEQAFIDFVGHANSDYSPLVGESYNRNRWLGEFGTTMTSYSTDTSVGIFTATVVYTRGVSSITSAMTVLPPVGMLPISTAITPISTEKVFYSTDAILSPPPTIVADRKIVEVDGLEPFNFRAGRRSDPQILRVRNVGAESVRITNIFATQFGVQGFAVSTATNLSEQAPFNILFNFNTLSIAPNDELQVLVYYTAPLRASTQVGTFYNSIIVSTDEGDFTVSTVQNVSAPEFDFRLDLTDYSAPYTYTDWAEEYGFNTTDRTLAINIANTYYLPNTDFGVIGNTRLYGLFRKPDAASLKFWVDRAKAAYASNYLSVNFRNEFLTSAASSTGMDGSRVITPNKFFDSGNGYGDFYDRTLVNTTISSNSPTTFYYSIVPEFGTLRLDTENGYGYVASLSNFRFNGSPSTEAQAAFSIDQVTTPGTGTVLRGPGIVFSPSTLNNIGTYSVDLTVTVNALDSLQLNTTVTKTENLTLELVVLSDRNLVKWISGLEEFNAVMGISYDLINGQSHLTVGIGSGSDGAPTLSANNYLSNFVNVDNLGVIGDSKWGTFPIGFGAPMYRVGFGAPWGAFINTYGVWPVNPPYNTYSYPATSNYLRYDYKFTAPSAGTYAIEFSVDNDGIISIDGTAIITSSNSYTGSVLGAVTLTQGEHTVTLQFRNAASATVGNAGGVAATIRNPSGNIVWSTLDPVRAAPPYAYWPEVYRIPIEANVARTYRLGDYLVKNSYPVNQMPLSANAYGAYFGTPGTNEVGSIMTVTDDGRGNLTFNWLLPGTTTGTNDDRTITGITQLPFYYSYALTRKANIAQATGPDTLKLVGMTTSAVRTVTAAAPGYSKVNIAVIDEASTPTAVTIQTGWNSYVANNPRDRFFLLQPTPTALNGSNLKVPPNFTTTLGVGPVAVARDNGVVASRSDWFTLCNLANYPRGTRISLSIDNSGSMTTASVSASYGFFLERCAVAGFTVTLLNMGLGENWIAPFITGA